MTTNQILGIRCERIGCPHTLGDHVVNGDVGSCQACVRCPAFFVDSPQSFFREAEDRLRSISVTLGDEGAEEILRLGESPIKAALAIRLAEAANAIHALNEIWEV